MIKRLIKILAEYTIFGTLTLMGRPTAVAVEPAGEAALRSPDPWAEAKADGRVRNNCRGRERQAGLRRDAGHPAA